VERILYNLVDNAIKYSPKGGEVKVSVRQDGDFLLVGVRDNGPGISRSDQARLFQSFERLGMKVNGIIQGTGLGLRVCRILVEAQGGRIWVHSEEGKGSTFFFTLPAVKR
jgi:signal transduction histidine kinase